jgi:hypothetical protein
MINNYLCTCVLYRPVCKVFNAGKSITRGGPWTLIREFETFLGQNGTSEASAILPKKSREFSNFFGQNGTSEVNAILPKKIRESRSRAHPK